MNAPFGYYTPPAVAQGRPAVIVLFRIYAGLGALLLLGAAVGGFVGLRAAPPPGAPVAIFVAMGIVFGVLGLVHAVAAVAPFEPWGWTLGLVLLVLGCMSGALFFAIPLLVYWLRPPCRAAFMRM